VSGRRPVVAGAGTRTMPGAQPAPDRNRGNAVDAREVLDRIDDIAPRLRDQADDVEREGRIPDKTAAMLRDTGVVRIMQPTEFGGYAADPRLFFEAVMKIGSYCGASGWVAGIIGVHPWELGQYDRRAQEEVWGD